MTSLRVVASLSMAALLAGCGGSSSSDKKMDLQGFIDGYADTMCSALAHCSCTDPSAVADCKTTYSQYMSYMTMEMFLSHPAIRISPTGARTCLDDLSALVRTCPGPTGGGTMVSAIPPMASPAAAVPESSGPIGFMNVPSCATELLIEGVQAEGEFCINGTDCAVGLACDRSQSKCVTAQAAEASCATIDGCAEGLYCSNAKVCVPIPAATEACSSSDRVCAKGSSCVQVSSVYTCVAPHTLDQSCTDGAGCAAGLYCDSTCKTLIADGDECDSSSQCAHDWCKSGVCADPGFCAMVLDW